MKLTKRLLAFAFSLIMLVTSLAACSTPTEQPSGDSGATTTAGDTTANPDNNCPHTSTVLSTPKEASCAEEGLSVYTCTACGTVTQSITLPKTEHKYVDAIPDGTVEAGSGACQSAKKCIFCKDTVVTNLESTHQLSQSTSYKNFKELSGSSAVYNEACKICGIKSEKTFTKAIAAKTGYVATSPTVSLYETKETLSYGFRWNFAAKPASPVIAVKEETAAEWTYYDAENDLSQADAHFCRAVVELKPATKYQYKLMEYATGAESEVFSFTSVQPDAYSFSFATFSDTQSANESPAYWNAVLEAVSDVDFFIHTGDICEDGSLEANFKSMLDSNREHLATTPLMPTTGNHDSTHKVGSNKNILLKHFNNNIPEQKSTEIGYFYSYTYGTAKFIVLNTNDLNPTNSHMYDEQINWLKEELDKPSLWTVVIMHEPLFSPGKWGYSQPTSDCVSLKLRTQLHSIFASYGVDLVIQGHDHSLNKSYPIDANNNVVAAETTDIDGISYLVNPAGPVYITNGTSGDRVNNLASSYEEKFFEYAELSEPSTWAEYSVNEGNLTVTVKYVKDGEVTNLYCWGITKG